MLGIAERVGVNNGCGTQLMNVPEQGNAAVVTDKQQKQNMTYY